MQIPTLTREPVRLRTYSKYGTDRASTSITRSRIEPTLPLMIIFVLDFIERGRIFCSSWIANGANSSAYLVIGVSTVAHSAILVKIRALGMLRVIWEFTSGPNILAPMKARDVYRTVTNEKLTMVTCKSKITKFYRQIEEIN